MRKLFCGIFLGITLGLPATPVFDITHCKPGDFRPRGHAVCEIQGDRLHLTIPVADPVDRWPGVTLLPQSGKHFNLSEGSVLAVDIKNLDSNPTLLEVEIANLKKSGATSKDPFDHVVYGGIGLNPHESATMRVRYQRCGEPCDWAPIGLKSTFDGFDETKYHIDPAHVDQLRFFITRNSRVQHLEISNIRVEEPPQPLPEAQKSATTFYPCIDRLGQFKHTEWSGKMHDESEFATDLTTEDADLANHPGIEDRTIYGGWASGPDFKATGHFYPIKYEGKWYLVDPTGKLFWSLGMDCVYWYAGTNLAKREHYFEDLPSKQGKFACCYSESGIRWHYRDYQKLGITKSPFYNFLLSNLIRKYGDRETAMKIYRERAPRRLKSWGFNTLGNWSELPVIRERQLPYVVFIDPNVKTVAGNRGPWRNFYDVFAPDFENAVAKLLKERYSDIVDDPWCIGFFVNNELNWGNETGLAHGVIASPASQPAKQALIELLRKKYNSIEALNQAWEASHSSWEAFAESTTPPTSTGAVADLTEFNAELVDRYFSTAQRVIRQYAPNKLYLGCRFAGSNEQVVQIAAKYVDVLSYNLYRYSLGNWQLPSGVDKPVLVGEWHFGTYHYGPPHPSLRPTASQAERARAFDRYVRSALWHPNIIGAHYFSFYDQATTGRAQDGENMQFGFLSIVDRPYPEMVDTARKVSKELYQLRLGK